MIKKNDRYAWTVKIGEKGQFVIPKEARDLFDIKPGDSIIVLADKKRGIAIPPKKEFNELLTKIFNNNNEEGSDDDNENNGDKKSE